MVGEASCGEGETLAYGTFLRGVDVVGDAVIEGHDHGGVGDIPGLRLGIPNEGESPAVGSGKGRELGIDPGKIPLVPSAAPFLDQRAELVFEDCVATGIRFSLIPDDTLDREWLERPDPAGVDVGEAVRAVG